MSQNVKHVLGISGGKDSAALAIYLNDKYPQMDVEYYSCDTGKELQETYDLIDNLEVYLGQKVKILKAVSDQSLDPFDHFLDVYGGYLPSNSARWCTKKLKLMPFEKYIAGQNPIISYVGIRGDEDREGYISKKPNVQSIFPFRKNIWSEGVIAKVLKNENQDCIVRLYQESYFGDNKDRILEIANTPLSANYNRKTKLGFLLDGNTEAFNKVVFQYLKTTAYPVGQLDDYALIDNTDILVRDDIFQILKDSGVGVPGYYEKREYKVEIDKEVKTGYYSRSRSGCFFCFFQQKIEWVWLYENHIELYKMALAYEKEGYTWQQGETLEELARPERVKSIKKEHYTRIQRAKNNFKSPNLVDILTDSDEWEVDWEEEEGRGCAACFI